MKLELFKEVVDREFEKCKKINYTYINSRLFFELESERDLYLALEYTNADIDYKTFINRYNWKPHVPDRQEIVAYELRCISKEYEYIGVTSMTGNSRERAMIGIRLSKYEQGIYVKITDKVTTIYKPIESKALGIYYGALEAEKKIYSKLNLVETIHKYVKERLEKEGIHL